MKNGTILIVMMLLVSPLLAAVRPPAMEPNDVPFVYEPNNCPSEVMDYIITEPNISGVYSLYAHNKWGLHIDLEVADCNGVIDVLVQRLIKEKDPNGGWNQYFQCVFTPNVPGVYYFEITATDKIGRQDRRTLLVLAVEDEAPFIVPGSPPVIGKTQIKNAQMLVQYAKKHRFPTTKPMRVWR